MTVTNQLLLPGSKRSCVSTMPFIAGKLRPQKSVASTSPKRARRCRGEVAEVMPWVGGALRPDESGGEASGRKALPHYFARKNKNAADCSAAFKVDSFKTKSGHVLRHELGHVEHADGGLATEHNLQRGVRVDVALVLGVLEAVLLDVGPELLGELRAGQRLRTHDGGESGVGGDRLHESGVGFTS